VEVCATAGSERMLEQAGAGSPKWRKRVRSLRSCDPCRCPSRRAGRLGQAGQRSRQARAV